MTANDLTLAFRHLRRNKLLTAINVFGLSIGISACLVIYLIASYELSFDKFQPDRDRIFRIYSTYSGVTDESYPAIPTAAARVIKDQFTGLESLTNFHSCNMTVKVPADAKVKDLGSYDKIIVAGPDYFDVFNYYEWLAGNPRQSLTEPFKVVLSESRARIYFGNIEPASVIGREIHYQDSLVVTVSGIVKDITERTDLDFTDFISFNTIERSWLSKRIRLDEWNSINSSSQLFLKIHAGTAVEKIEAQISKLADSYKARYNDSEWHYPARMQPFTDLHFNTDLGVFDSSRSVMEKSTLEILVVVAGLLLLIASINFINLETAQASKRSKEVGVRKVLGSSRGRLISRFLWESFILCFLAVGLSVICANVTMQYFSEYIPQGLVLDITQPTIFIFLISCLVVVTLLAGLYPAFILSSHQPAAALKDITTLSHGMTRSAVIRKSLTVFQFSFSQVLIVGTIAIAFQLHFMVNKDLGFNPQAVVWMSTPYNGPGEKLLAFQNELEQIPEIQRMSLNDMPPVASGTVSSSMNFDNGKGEVTYPYNEKRGDTSYLGVYGIRLLAGRNLLPIDSAREFLINETLMHKLGVDDPRKIIGKTSRENYSIVGVVEDFHTESLHAPVLPTVISYDGRCTGMAMKIFASNNKVSDMKPALKKIETAWKKVYPDEKFEYSFIDQRMKRFYETEQRTGKLARAATVIAILISCLGLFGLSSYTVLQRTKEIGIRKVLGATVNNIWFLLSKDILVLIFIACILSAPIGYYAVELWLQGFAYRIDITAWIFIGSGIISVLVALITMSFRTVRAAQSDPVKSLRYE